MNATEEMFELIPSVVKETRSYNRRPMTAKRIEDSTVKLRKKFLANVKQSGMEVLFEELFQILQAPIYFPLYDLLQKPLCPNVNIPNAYKSDVAGVGVIDAIDGDDDADEIEIPYVPWGQAWFADNKGLNWSKEGLLLLQVKLFWRSLDELALSNNELEKWSVLKWVFRPTVWKHYVFDRKIGKSHCFPVHERDDPFSFHNCCIAARVLADVIREGVRRNVPVEVIKAVDKVCTFD